MIYRTRPDNASPQSRDGRNIDAVVIGDGLIGLSTAYELAGAGAAVCLVGASRDGTASEAAAGLLAPSVGSLSDSTRAFFDASLAKFPEFLARIQDFDPTLHLQRGLIEVLPAGATVRPRLPPKAVPLGPAETAQLQPGLHAPFGAVLHPDDGAVDNVRLVRALRKAVSNEAAIDWRRNTPATRLDATNTAAAVHVANGSVIHADWAILAAGAWSARIEGVPRRVPVFPLKGQMLALEPAPIDHPIMGADVYIVPRRNEVAIGATVENAGFDLTTTDEAIERLRSAAVDLIPSLASSPIRRRWAGIRPATPDMLPVIGADPDAARLIYACGHSKNGILLAPGTAAAVAALVRGLPPEFDLRPFSVTRFRNTVGE